MKTLRKSLKCFVSVKIGRCFCCSQVAKSQKPIKGKTKIFAQTQNHLAKTPCLLLEAQQVSKEAIEVFPLDPTLNLDLNNIY